MGEYQYYDFLALDRPLTPTEQETVSRLSSRVEPHPWRATFVYHWSDLPTDPEKLLAKSYDQATRLLVQLSELAAHQGQEAAFAERLDRLVETYSRRSTFLDRLRAAGLLAGTP